VRCAGYPPTRLTRSWRRRWRPRTSRARPQPTRPSASGGGCWGGAWRRSAPAAGCRSALTCCGAQQGRHASLGKCAQPHVPQPRRQLTRSRVFSAAPAVCWAPRRPRAWGRQALAQHDRAPAACALERWAAALTRAAALQSQGGQAAASIGAVGTDTNLSCDGCPTTDTRSQARVQRRSRAPRLCGGRVRRALRLPSACMSWRGARGAGSAAHALLLL
jgi:hypothetical protein